VKSRGAVEKSVFLQGNARICNFAQKIGSGGVKSRGALEKREEDRSGQRER
jgi:hypothetical protein